MSHRYELVVYWNTEDGLYVAEVSDLSGCTAHGATPEEAVANAQDAIGLWIETAREFGDEVPEPRERRPAHV